MSVADRPDLFFTDLVRDPKGVIDRTVKSGFSNRALADTAAWAWEMAAQVEAVAARPRCGGNTWRPAACQPRRGRLPHSPGPEPSIQ